MESKSAYFGELAEEVKDALDELAEVYDSYEAKEVTCSIQSTVIEVLVKELKHVRKLHPDLNYSQSVQNAIAIYGKKSNDSI